MVSIFATCLVDTFFPEIGMGMVRILDHLGVMHNFPEAQTCCGQPAFNAGYPAEAGMVGRAFGRAFAESEQIVTPSASCAAYARHHLHDSRVMEISEFIVDVLGVRDLGVRSKAARAVVHNGCHGMRLLGLGPQAVTLLENVAGLELLDFERPEECCGFGGMFSVKMADISAAMMDSKLDCMIASGADFGLTGDPGCLMHLNGGLSRRGSPFRIRHYAEFLGGLI